MTPTQEDVVRMERILHDHRRRVAVTRSWVDVPIYHEDADSLSRFLAYARQGMEMKKLAAWAMFWFNDDGSPVDGFRAREHWKALRDFLGGVEGVKRLVGMETPTGEQASEQLTPPLPPPAPQPNEAATPEQESA